MFNAIIVDDDACVRKGLKSLINWKKLNFNLIDLCSDGREGLSVILEKKPDLIISDIMMPEMNGIEMLKSIRNENYSPEIIFITGHRHFDYARSALNLGASDILLKPAGIDVFTDSISNAGLRLSSKQKELCILEEARTIVSRDKIQQNRKELNDFIFNNKRYQLLPIEVQDLLPSNTDSILLYIGPLHTGSILSKTLDLSRILNETYERKYRFIELESESSEHWYLIQSHNSHLNLDVLCYEIRELLSLINQNMLNDLQWSFSSIFRNYSEIPQAGKELKRQIKGNNLETDDIKRFPVIKAEVPGDIFMRLCHPGDSNKEKEIQQLIQEYGRRSGNAADMDIIRNHFWQGIRDTLSYFHQKRQHSPAELIDDGSLYYVKILQTGSREEIEQVFKQFLQEELKKFEESKHEHLNKIVKIAEEYINENYDNPALSLQDVSDRCRTSKSHLSRVFKQRNGLGFSQYLNSIRIEKAKLYIREGNYFLYEVGEKVGFPDPQYFSRVFKKICGCSPRGYQNRIQDSFDTHFV